MKLFEVTNGFIGESYVKIFVIHDTTENALKLAEAEFKKTATTDHYSDDYWKDLTVKEICSDTSKIWFNGPRDC